MVALTGAALAATLALCAGQDAQEWARAWQRLARLRAAETPREEHARLREELGELASRGEPGPRRRLLDAHLRRLEDPSLSVGAAELGFVDGRGLSPEESWLVAEILRAGEGRLSALGRAMRASETLDRAQLELVWTAALGELDALRFDTALPLLEDLHSRYRAEWTAINLSLAYGASGRGELAERVVADQIERETQAGAPATALWSRRGNAAWGNGDEGRARDYFGKALALGSPDAAIVLARLDLCAGRVPHARAGFRAMVLDEEPSAWALRGWGLSLLADPGPGRPRSQEPTNRR